MYNVLVNLYGSNNDNRKLALKNHLRNIKMIGSDFVTNYLMKITQVKDELVALAEKIEESDLVTIALNGFPSSWEPFIQGICACGKLPSFD